MTLLQSRIFQPVQCFYQVFIWRELLLCYKRVAPRHSPASPKCTSLCYKKNNKKTLFSFLLTTCLTCSWVFIDSAKQDLFFLSFCTFIVRQCHVLHVGSATCSFVVLLLWFFDLNLLLPQGDSVFPSVPQAAVNW